MNNEKSTRYPDVEFFIKPYVNHGITGLASFYGILEYANVVDDITYEERKNLLDEFVGMMFCPEDYE